MQYSITNYSHHAVPSIHMTYLFYNWKFLLFEPLHPFRHPLPLATANLFSVSVFHGKILLSECCSHEVSLSIYKDKSEDIKFFSQKKAFLSDCLAISYKAFFKSQSNLNYLDKLSFRFTVYTWFKH